MNIYEFMGEHPIVTVYLAWLLVTLIVDLAKVIVWGRG